MSINSNSQNVSVDKFTGTANVTFSLLSARKGNVIVPISLNYNGGGIKVRDVEGSAGLGWSLSVGGEIRREVRGLPDDSRIDNAGNRRPGWIYNGAGTAISSFSVANDNSQSTCTDETADLSYISSNLPSTSDSEPDIYNVNVPGLHCQLVFDNNHVVRTIPYQDIRVTYTTETSVSNSFPAYGRIKDFTITTTDGNTYFFAGLETATRTTTTSGTVSYFNNEYDQYHNGMDYVLAWKLSKITDVNHNTVDFSYHQNPITTSNTRLALNKGGGAGTFYPFTAKVWTKQLVLDRIHLDDNGPSDPSKTISLTFTTASASRQPLIQQIRGLGQQIDFSYLDCRRMPYTLGTPVYSQLRSVTLPGNKRYDFTYYGTTANTSYGQLALPDSTSTDMDQWGYYNASGEGFLFPRIFVNPSNPSLERYRVNDPGSNSAAYTMIFSGAARAVNATVIANGALKAIKFPYGGSTTLTYEPNDYYDPTAGGVVMGGGIRIKQVVTADSVNAAGNITESYSYADPSTGLSSGRPISLPTFAFTTPYTGGGTVQTQWQNSTVVSEEDVTGQDNSIVYQNVRLTRQGAGSELYQYSVPATYWDAGASPDWAPTIANIGRPGCISAGLADNRRYAYPFAPNMNFDFERGLVTVVKYYNEDSTPKKVGEYRYEYERNGTPVAVSGFRSELNNGVTSYAKYTLLADVDNRIKQVNSRVYDLPALSTSKLTTYDYFYGSSNHREATTVKTTASDGSIVRRTTKYLKDYATTATGDDNNVSLHALKQAGMNMPIESYSQVERGGVNRTIASTLTTFKAFSFGALPTLYLPYRKLQFASNGGVTDFAISNTTGGTSSVDSRYKIMETDSIYADNGTLLTKQDRSRIPTTVISNFYTNLPAATVAGARVSEIVFDNFDTPSLPTRLSNNLASSLDSLNARSGMYDVQVTSSNLLSRSLNRNMLASNYVLSLWIRSSNAGSLAVSTIAGSTSTYSLSYSNTGSDWKYYELKVPVSGITGAFTVQLQASGSVNLDDILFLPEQAEATTMAYNARNLLQASTDANGVSKYYEYDSYGRSRYVRDQDKNIVYKKNYLSASAANVGVPTIQVSAGEAYANAGINYNNLVGMSYSTGYAEALDGTKATWNFGDGTATAVTFNTTAPHVYRAAGSYTVGLTLESPIFGTRTASSAVTIPASSSALTQISATGLGANGTITGINVYQGSTLVATLSQSSLQAGTATLPQGVYSAQIIVSGFAYSTSHTGGYKSVRFTATGPHASQQNCAASASGTASYPLYIDLNGATSANFSCDTLVCSGGGVE